MGLEDERGTRLGQKKFRKGWWSLNKQEDSHLKSSYMLCQLPPENVKCNLCSSQDRKHCSANRHQQLGKDFGWKRSVSLLFLHVGKRLEHLEMTIDAL